MGKFNKIPIILLMLLIIILPGCWDNNDVAKVSIIVAIGVDKGEDGLVEVTIQSVIPQGKQSNSNGNSGDDKEVWVYSSTGLTTADALNNILKTINLPLFLGHLQLLVIGEELAKEGVLSALEFFERYHEARQRAYVVVAKGTTAKTILNARSDIESIPALHIVNIIENDAMHSKTVKYKFFDLMRDIISEGKNPSVAVIEIADNGELKIKDIKLQGLGAFRGDRLVGYIDPDSSRGKRFISHEISNAIISINNPFSKGDYVSIEINRSSSSIDVIFKEENPVLIIHVDTEGDIVEIQGYRNLTTQESLKKLEEEVKRKIEGDIDGVIVKSRILKSDILGCGEIVRRKFNEYWKENKENWEEIFSIMEHEIHINFKIRNSRLFLEPSKPQ